MKKTFAFALLLTLCSGSSAFGMDQFNRVVDAVAKVADTAFNLKNAPILRTVFHPKENKASVAGVHSRYPRAIMSLFMMWRAWKSETGQKCAHAVADPVKRMMAKKK